MNKYYYKIKHSQKYLLAKRQATQVLIESLGERFGKLSKKDQDKISDEIAFYFVDEVIDLERRFKESNHQTGEMIIFILGIIIAITGGLITNVIHVYLSDYMLIYSLFATGLFLISSALIVLFYYERSSRTLDSGIAKRFSEQAKKELERMENSKQKK